MEPVPFGDGQRCDLTTADALMRERIALHLRTALGIRTPAGEAASRFKQTGGTLFLGNTFVLLS